MTGPSEMSPAMNPRAAPPAGLVSIPDGGRHPHALALHRRRLLGHRAGSHQPRLHRARRSASHPFSAVRPLGRPLGGRVAERAAVQLHAGPTPSAISRPATAPRAGGWAAPSSSPAATSGPSASTSACSRRALLTLGNAHFELLIPGTTDHQVLSWELAEQLVTVDMVRSGLLAAAPGSTAPINAAPGFRQIPAEIYNLLPAELRAASAGRWAAWRAGGHRHRRQRHAVRPGRGRAGGGRHRAAVRHHVRPDHSASVLRRRPGRLPPCPGTGGAAQDGARRPGRRAHERILRQRPPAAHARGSRAPGRPAASRTRPR